MNVGFRDQIALRGTNQLQHEAITTLGYC